MITQGIVAAIGAGLGASVASFANVVADRLPNGGSLLSPPSHCPACRHRLAAWELVPVLSYLALRGRCHECGAPIPWRVPVVEAAGAILFGFAAWRFGIGLDAVLMFFALGFMLTIVVIDLEHRLVLNSVLLAALPVALVSAPLWSESLRDPMFALGSEGLSAIVDALAGGVVGFAIFLAFAALARGGMGGGDVKLVGVIGVWTGLRILPVALMLAVVSAGLIAILLLLFRLRKRKDAIPFAPYLAGGTVVALFWGQAIGDWYLGLLS